MSFDDAEAAGVDMNAARIVGLLLSLGEGVERRGPGTGNRFREC
jgi:hypothetical protein